MAGSNISSNTTLPALSGKQANLKAYLEHIREIEILTPLEEQQLALQWYEKGDRNAAQKLIMANLRYVVYVARSYNGYGLPLSDLIQEGNLGLMKAVKRFDPHRGVRLITFAVYWIKSEIHNYIMQNWRIVKVATTNSQRKLFFNLRSSRKRLAWLTESEIKDIARDLKVDIKDVREMEKRLTFTDTAYDDYSDEDAEGDALAPVHYLGDDSMSPAVLVEQSEWEEKLHQALAGAIKELDPKSRNIVESRWLAAEKATLQDLAKEHGISAERVRQIEQDAFKKVRTHLKGLRG